VTTVREAGVRGIIVAALGLIAGTVAVSAQAVIKTDIERDYNGRVSSVTSTGNRGTVRTDYTYSGDNVQAVTTFERKAPGGYNPLGQGGYKPLGR
jgi:hypothetical protein